MGSRSPVAATQTAASDEVARDLGQLISALDSIHPNAWHGIDREDFVAALDAYEAALPNYTPDEAVAELMRVVALLSRAAIAEDFLAGGDPVLDAALGE
jgi:hypothetical protein